MGTRRIVTQAELFLMIWRSQTPEGLFASRADSTDETNQCQCRAFLGSTRNHVILSDFWDPVEYLPKFKPMAVYWSNLWVLLYFGFFWSLLRLFDMNMSQVCAFYILLHI